MSQSGAEAERGAGISRADETIIRFLADGLDSEMREAQEVIRRCAGCRAALRRIQDRRIQLALRS